MSFKLDRDESWCDAMHLNRLQISEARLRLYEGYIVNTLNAMLELHGIAVYLEAYHLCAQMRGVREVAPLTRITFWRGEYDHHADLRAEFLKVGGGQP